MFLRTPPAFQCRCSFTSRTPPQRQSPLIVVHYRGSQPSSSQRTSALIFGCWTNQWSLPQQQRSCQNVFVTCLLVLHVKLFAAVFRISTQVFKVSFGWAGRLFKSYNRSFYKKEEYLSRYYSRPPSLNSFIAYSSVSSRILIIHHTLIKKLVLQEQFSSLLGENLLFGP